MIGFPPAGGWVTFNKIIKKTPNPTAIGIVIAAENEKYSIKMIEHIKPIIDVVKWPKNTFLPLANGLSGYPSTKTIEDPKDATRNSP